MTKRFFTLISFFLIVSIGFANCQNKAERYCGATSKTGRQFVARSNDFVHKVTSENVYKLGKHVTVMEMQFTSVADSIIKPYSIFAAEIELKKDVAILSTCVGDNPESIKPTREEQSLAAPMRDHLHAMQARRPGSDVLCGINADFFMMNASNCVLGIMHKDGECLKGTFDGNRSNAAFAIMKDGTARIITKEEYESQKDNIQEAVGGGVILVSEGRKVQFTDKSVHPRTAVGISANHKKVYFLVVDGRRKGYSVGVDYDKLGTLFVALGANEALNLDGGGSSSFLIRNDEADKGFETRNRPTDKSGDRVVPNGLAVVYSN